MTYRFLLVLAAVALAAPAWAAPAGPDLAVTMTPPVGAHVYESAGYNVRVRNVGNKNAAGVRVTIQLPTTRTSPTVYLMGTLGAYSSSCARSGNALVCTLGTLAKNASVSVFFDMLLPYSTMPIVFTATATTTTAGERNPANNTLSHTASPLTYPVTMNHVDPATHSHCTGNPSLSSYFECALFPSSISEHETVFNADGTITFIGVPASFTGSWTYTAATHRLQFEYLDGGLSVATFDGRGTTASGKCFEGKTLFPDNPDYVSIYRVCFP